MIGAILTITPAFIFGFILYLVLVDPPNRKSLIQYYFIAFFSAFGLGIGAISEIYFLWISIFGEFNNNYVILEIMLNVLILFVYIYKLRRRNKLSLYNYKNNSYVVNRKINLLLITVVVFMTAIACILFFILTRSFPHGKWDAWYMWNMKARFLYNAGDRWTELFNMKDVWLKGSGPLDYPFLLSGFIARCWKYLGDMRTVLPAVVAFIFTFSSIALLGLSVSIIRGKSTGLLAVITLLICKTYIYEGSSQYADIPLSYFILGSLINVYFHKHFNDTKYLLLAGIFAGFAAWTKNEGLLFLIVLLLAFIFQDLRSNKNLSGLSMKLFAGIIPGLFIVLYFKYNFAYKNQLFYGNNIYMTLKNITDVSRHIIILKGMGKTIIKLLVPIVAIGITLFQCKLESVNKRCIQLIGAILCIMLSSYYMVYLITPQPLEWHLATSHKRVILQLWPAIVFFYFLVVFPFPENIRTDSER